jgi:hypothetical protein
VGRSEAAHGLFILNRGNSSHGFFILRIFATEHTEVTEMNRKSKGNAAIILSIAVLIFGSFPSVFPVISVANN